MDNVQAGAAVGLGQIFAADVIATVAYPRNKITIGADGVDGGDVAAANPLPVYLATVGNTQPVSLASVPSHDVTNAGTFAVQATQAGTWTVTGAGGSFPISDDGGSITVDNTGTFAVQATQSGTWTVTGAGGTFPVTDSGGSLTVDNGGTFAVQVTSIAAGTNAIGKLAANSGVIIGAVEIAAAQTLATVTTVGTVTTCSTVTTVSTLTGSGIAHDATDSGNPHKIGAKAIAALSTLTKVAATDRSDLYCGVDGVLLNRPHTNLEDIVTGNASNTDGTSTACIAAQTGSIKTYLTSIILTNTSASMVYVEIKDGSTVKLTIPVPATGGAIFNPPVPIPGSAATAWNFDPSAAATTVYCSMVGFRSLV